MTDREEEDFYRFSLPDRRQLLVKAGFVRSEDSVWRHVDGRMIGEGVVAALVDRAFFRYIEHRAIL